MNLMALSKCLLKVNYNSKIFTKIRLEKFKNLKVIDKKILNTNFDSIQPVRKFSTTASTRSGIIPPLLWLIAKPLTKLSALIAGRYLSIY